MLIAASIRFLLADLRLRPVLPEPRGDEPRGGGGQGQDEGGRIGVVVVVVAAGAGPGPVAPGVQLHDALPPPSAEDGPLRIRRQGDRDRGRVGQARA